MCLGDETDVESDSDDEWSTMRWGNPDWYSMEQWEAIMDGVLKEHEDWHKELKKAWKTAWHKLHKQEENDKSRAWRQTNKDHFKDIKRKWREANKDKEKEKRSKRHQRDKEKENERSRIWAKTNLTCKTCKLFQVERRGMECASCGGHRCNSAEYEVRDYIREWYPQAVFDKQIEGSCLRYRPDIFIETPWGCLVVEVDEQEHRDYDPNCEVVREFNIRQALGCDLTIIRYNPDSYKPDGKTTQRLTKEERLGALFLAMRDAYETHRCGLTVDYLFYSSTRIVELTKARNKLPE